MQRAPTLQQDWECATVLPPAQRSEDSKQDGEKCRKRAARKSEPTKPALLSSSSIRSWGCLPSLLVYAPLKGESQHETSESRNLRIANCEATESSRRLRKAQTADPGADKRKFCSVLMPTDCSMELPNSGQSLEISLRKRKRKKHTSLLSIRVLPTLSIPFLTP